MVRTLAFHQCGPGSNPVGDASNASVKSLFVGLVHVPFNDFKHDSSLFCLKGVTSRESHGFLAQTILEISASQLNSLRTFSLNT